MEPEDEGRLVGFDATGAIATAREMTDDAVLAGATYTPEDYEVLYVADRLKDRYEEIDGGDIDDVGEQVHRYSKIDFFERETFADLYPTLDATEAFATFTDFAVVVRVVAENEGLYVSFDAGTAVTPVVERLCEIVSPEERGD